MTTKLIPMVVMCLHYHQGQQCSGASCPQSSDECNCLKGVKGSRVS
jgi:hypothetical protein